MWPGISVILNNFVYSIGSFGRVRPPNEGSFYDQKANFTILKVPSGLNSVEGLPDDWQLFNASMIDIMNSSKAYSPFT
jgi:hypothetical protein